MWRLPKRKKKQDDTEPFPIAQDPSEMPNDKRTKDFERLTQALTKKKTIRHRETKVLQSLNNTVDASGKQLSQISNPFRDA